MECNDCKKRCTLDCPLTIIGPRSNDYGRGWKKDEFSDEFTENLKKLLKKTKYNI